MILISTELRDPRYRVSQQDVIAHLLDNFDCRFPRFTRPDTHPLSES